MYKNITSTQKCVWLIRSSCCLYFYYNTCWAIFLVWYWWCQQFPSSSLQLLPYRLHPET